MKKLIMFIMISIKTFGLAPIISNDSIHHPIKSKYGMVASQESLASKVGIDILSQGGNAIDAAVAIGFTLAVTFPQAGNLGGGGFMMIHIASENRTIALDFRETAPNNASENMYINEDGSVNSNRSRFTTLASGTPGSVHGLLTALEKYGTLPRKDVLKSAIHYAENGIVVSSYLHESLEKAYPRLSKHHYTASIFYPNNRVLKPGEKLIQKDLANILKKILNKGKDGFYKGDTANKIHNFMKSHQGLITKNDLKNYRSIERTPIHGTYRNYDILSMPPPSSGGIAILQILKKMEPYPIQEWGHNSAKTIHIMSEAMSLAYADRAEWLGDSDFVNVPIRTLISNKYLKTRIINPTHHTPSKQVQFGALKESDETTHYSIIDQWGNAVSVTTTLNFSYGSGIAVTNTGILLNNEMDDFSAKPGVPNAYGLIGNKRNAIYPNKRMLSSMTPTIILKDGQVFLVTGSPGGSRIITTVTQIISNVIDHKMNIAEASAASRFHHQWYPDEIRIEKGFSQDTLSILKTMGHKISKKKSMGSTQSIMKINGELFGISDPRTPSALTIGI